MINQYSTFFAAFNASQKRGNPFTREEIVFDFTGGKTKSLKDLSRAELSELTLYLNRLNGNAAAPNKYANDKADKMRKSIIAIFHNMGRSVQDAIAWAEKQGVRGVKKKFNDYTTGELYVLIGIAEKIKADYATAIRKRITDNG